MNSSSGSDLDFLKRLADAVLPAAFAAARSHAAVARAGGDAVQAFTHALSEAARSFVVDRGKPLLLLSEEGPPRRYGRGAPTARVIVNPLDGRENFAAGLPFSAFSNFCAAIAAPAGPLDVVTVRAALVRPLAAVPFTFMLEGRQAWREIDTGKEPLRVTEAQKLEKVVITVALDGHAPGRNLTELMERARAVRAPGGCSAALLALARGQTGAHIDIRTTLTAQDWLAAAAMVRAAGGVITLLDATLEQAPAPMNLLERRTLIAAANRELLEEILARLRKAVF